MANFPCPNVIICNPCPDGDPTRANLSAELPDVESFFAIVHYYGTPPLGGTWQEAGCTELFTSTISQADAEQKALAAAQECAWAGGNPISGGWRNPGSVENPNGTLRTIFTNSPQTCTAPCSDGSLSTFTVEGGTFLAFSQIEADERAHNYCVKQVTDNVVCLEEIGGAFCCQNTFGSFDLKADILKPVDSTEWSIVSGNLPQGMTLVPDPDFVDLASIQGTPTQLGTFNFAVQVQTSAGAMTMRSYTVHIGGISQSSLPSGRFGVAYSTTLTTSGLTGAVVFTLLGSLPSGLSFNTSTGAITGTPQQQVSSTFNVLVTDSINNSCFKTFTIVISAGFFSPLTASWALISGSGSGSCSGTQGNLSSTVHPFGPPASIAQAWRASFVTGSAGSTLFSAAIQASFGAHVADPGNTVAFSLKKNGLVVNQQLQLSDSGSASFDSFFFAWNPGDTIQADFAIGIVNSGVDPSTVTGILSFTSSN